MECDRKGTDEDRKMDGMGAETRVGPRVNHLKRRVIDMLTA